MSKNRTTEELFVLWGMLDIDFFQLKPASHEQVAEQVLDWILWRERLRNNLEKTVASHKESDAKTIRALKSMDTNNPQLVLLEKVFKRLVNGRGKDAMHLLHTAIQNKENEITKRQSRIGKASRPKGRHPLSSMVDPIVERNIKIKSNDLFHALMALAKNNHPTPCQFDFSKNAFIPLNKSFDPVPKKNLADYLFRAKARIKRANRLE
jgi:hypothetical protein